jgi:hypothetical protein
MAADLDAEIWGVMAASGSGKGVWLKQQLFERKPARLVIWDFKNEYGPFGKLIPSLGQVRKLMIAAGDSGPLAIRYKPQSFDMKAMRAEFEALCTLVQAWENCWFLAEELSNVTMPSWAPPAWRMMTTGGRHEGITIIGVSQNPALIDKTFLSNCTLIHVGQLHEHAHRNAVEKSMDIAPGALADLVQFQFVQKHRKTGEFATGVVRIKGVKAPATPSVPTRRGRGAAAPSQAALAPATLAPLSPLSPKPRGKK